MKTEVIAFISVLLFSTIAGPLLINFAAANPRPVGSFEVNILSPKSGWTYRTPIEVTFQYNEPFQYFTKRRYYFSLDGQGLGLNLTEVNGSYHATLPILPNGEHTLRISVVTFYGTTFYLGSSVVKFTVDYAAPRVTVLPLENATCTGNDVALGFRVTDSSLSWVGYSLDGKENVTISNEALAQTATGPITTWSGNLSFTGLSSGSHSLTVYASNEVGYTGASKTLYFTVAQPQETGSQPPASEPFPTTLVTVASSASLAAIGTALTVYFKKRRTQ